MQSQSEPSCEAIHKRLICPEFIILLRSFPSDISLWWFYYLLYFVKWKFEATTHLMFQGQNLENENFFDWLYDVLQSESPMLPDDSLKGRRVEIYSASISSSGDLNYELQNVFTYSNFTPRRVLFGHEFVTHCIARDR